MHEFTLRATELRDYDKAHRCTVLSTVGDKLVVGLQPPYPGSVYGYAEDFTRFVLAPRHAGSSLVPTVSQFPCRVHICAPTDNGDWEHGPFRVLDWGIIDDTTMSMADYEQAKAIIENNASKAMFAGPRPEALINKAEEALGANLPAIYRRFLLEYGAGNFGPAEFYGVIDDDFENSSVPDGIWYTLNARRQANLSHELVVVASAGTGEIYVLDLSEADAPVVIIDPGSDTSVREKVAQDFGAFFLQQVQQVAG